MAGRLDEVLAGLRAGDSPHARVVPLRRPSRLPRLVLAAAAVLVVGFGVTQVLDSATMQDSDSAGGSTSAEDSDAEKESTDDGAAGPDAASGDGAPPPETFEPLDELGIDGLEPIRRATLERDLAALEDTQEQAGALRSTRRLSGSCGPREPAAGSRTLAAAYDGRPTLVVYLAPDGGSQRVDLYLCDTERPRRPFRSVTLPSGK